MKKLNKRNILNSYLVLFIVVLTAGCKVTDELGTVKADKNLLAKAEFIQLRTPIEFSFKGKIDLSNKANRIGGKVKIINNSEVHIQLISKTIGIEILKVHLFGDSIIYLNKIDKKYFIGDLATFLGSDVLTTADIIKLLTGRYVSLIDKPVITYSVNTFHFSSKNGLYNQELMLNKSNLLSHNSIVYGNIKLNTNYGNYVKYNVPGSLVMLFQINDLIISGNFDIFAIQKLEDKNVNISIPKGYTIFK
ncbi:MAG: DUF4292 domain-containing protein [Salinivirgaceae bacterium]|nr:DUF4292 domain-containing protein [Salinivirgaceae bacterium]